MGSASKLRTYTDGIRILRTIITLVKEERPLQFFSFIGLLLMLAGLLLGLPVVFEFLRTQLVPRLPTAVLATGLVLLSFLSFGCGPGLRLPRPQGDQAPGLPGHTRDRLSARQDEAGSRVAVALGPEDPRRGHTISSPIFSIPSHS